MTDESARDFSIRARVRLPFPEERPGVFVLWLTCLLSFLRRNSGDLSLEFVGCGAIGDHACRDRELSHRTVATQQENATTSEVVFFSAYCQLVWRSVLAVEGDLFLSVRGFKR